MKTKPLVFHGITFVSLVIAISLPLQIMAINEHTLNEYQSIFYKVSHFNWLVMGICSLNAYLAIKASSGLKLTLPLSLVAIALNNYQVSINSQDYGAFVPTASTIAYLGLLVGISSGEKFRKIMMNPNMRWWQTPERYKANFETWVGPNHQGHLVTETFDVSKTGAFLILKEAQDPRWKSLSIGDDIQISVRLDNIDAIQCRAKVIRFTQSSTGQYPEGIGVQFESMTPRGKKLLNKLLDRAKSGLGGSSSIPSSFAA